MKRLARASLLIFLLGSISKPLTATIGEDIAGATVLPEPSVDLGPGDVVKIVIQALSRNDEPHGNAGIETTYNFASPSNKANTGPLARFIRMVKAPPYGIMVDHAESEFSEVVLMGYKAYQMVRLVAADGRVEIFAFRLSKQRDGEFKDMWMTDAVWPVATEAVPGRSF